MTKINLNETKLKASNNSHFASF